MKILFWVVGCFISYFLYKYIFTYSHCHAYLVGIEIIYHSKKIILVLTDILLLYKHLFIKKPVVFMMYIIKQVKLTS